MTSNSQFIVLFFGIWGTVIASSLIRWPSGLRHLVSALMLLAYGFLLFALKDSLSVGQKLLLSTILLLQLIKSTYLTMNPSVVFKSLQYRSIALYYSIWPAFDLERLQSKIENQQNLGRDFVKGYLIAWMGVTLIVLLAVLDLQSNVTGWLAVLGFLLMLHFGFSRMLFSGLAMTGINAYPLFNEPLCSKSLQDFWSKRWNVPFVEMNKLCFMPLVRDRFPKGLTVFLIFLLSGLLHELGISYPVNAGWGLPTLYFMIQGLSFLFERKFLLKSEGWLKRLWTALVVILPLPLLFHHSFREQVLAGSLSYLHDLLHSQEVSWYWDKTLWLASAGHFLVLAASFQVPKKLNWNEELSRLSPLNRKLMWTYGVFIVFVIVAMGSMGLFLHQEILNGEKGSLVLAAFTALFWLARVLTDAFYFKHSDWPTGNQFIVGHTLLNTLFLFLMLSHGAIVWKHAF